MENLIDSVGEPGLMAISGAFVGLIFGLAAYHSRFCLRAATAEVAGGTFGPRLAIWLIAFLSALFCVQFLTLIGALDVSSARQLAATGSMSGAIIGGLIFGCGMILARGCVSRLLVLSASGNLRAIITGLVVTLTAQAALSGALAPLRETLARLWTVPGGDGRYLIQFTEATQPQAAAIALGALLLAFVFATGRQLRASEQAAAFAVGGAVALGWLLTFTIAAASFEVVAVQSVTFTGPSTDTLMALVNRRDLVLTFGLGLVPGVFIGALVAALWKGEARIQRFGPDVPMERYLIGGVLMGFGSMLAGGCAVGAGVSGGSILAVTAWVAVFCMWVGAVLTQLMLTSWWPGTTATT